MMDINEPLDALRSNINSVSYEMLGPVFDNDFCMMYSFKLLDIVDLEFYPAQ